MSYLKMVMSQGNKNAELEIENSVIEERNTLLRGLLRFFGVKDPVEVIKQGLITPNQAIEEHSFKIPEIAILPLPPIPHIPHIPAIPPVKKDQPQGRPKQLPLIGSERTMHTEIRELISRPNGTDNQLVFPDGHSTYEVRYWCKNPKCRDKGKMDIEVGQRAVRCPSCQTQHRIRNAAPNGERDSWGNLFIADSIFTETGMEGLK